ncbi:molybdopterin-dependent oxidoreductase [Natrinema pallidum]|uniref:Oxidoreductase molybdopterin binding protein n=1 Tax=Natrinema pallidum DSM 3751 TaxID=1227495 RepID=L9YWN7_9EURY|nr:molybdopterin-dependent oxidoreductase [Natrinema pallidum]ELY78630.1 oxidoreductase molybdopterin binding protein [Natrinema pallidum DSM 3751]
MTPHLSRLTNAHVTWRALTAMIAAVAAVAGSFAYAGLTPAFIGEPAATFVVETMPAAIVNAVLDTLGSFAEPASFLLALALVIAVLTGVIFGALQFGAVADIQYLAVPLAGGLVWLLAAWTTGAPIAAIAAGFPAAAVVGIVEVAAARDPLSVRRDRTVDRSKRATLQAGFGTLSLSGLAYVAGRRRTPDSSVPYLDGGTRPPVAERALLTQANGDAFDLPNAPGLISEIGDFYTVDINTIDPIVDRADWSLSVTGAVSSEVELEYDELRDRDADRFYSTLRCVGEDLNDREMDTAVWTGIPVTDLLAAAGADEDAAYAVIHAVDGYWNTVTREAIERSYVVYGMNGRVLPREHGHPVRLLVPGNWGEVNVKWISEIELTENRQAGYWDERGWDGTGEVETVAKLWSVDRGDDGTITVGGHAYAGLEGVETVEVSTDGGDTWVEAELSPPLEGEPRDVWRQWRHSFEPTADSHEVVVRTIDGTGAVQTEEPSGAKPDGATGWVSRTIES